METLIEKKKKIATSRDLVMNNHPEFGIELGTMSRHNPSATYMVLTTWISSNIDNELNDNYIIKLDKHLSRFLYHQQHDDLVFDKSRTISVLECTTHSNINTRTPRFLSIDVTLFQHRRKCLEWNDYNLQMYMEYYTELIIEELKSFPGLHFQLRK